jgi:hypothetical protein
MATSQPADTQLDGLALIEAQIRGDLAASVAIPDSADSQAVVSWLARICALLLQSVSPDPLAAIALLRVVATPGAALEE